ncbi:MAG: hypothetical protein ACJAZI_000999 [Cycloclasticus sp.]
MAVTEVACSIKLNLKNGRWLNCSNCKKNLFRRQVDKKLAKDNAPISINKPKNSPPTRKLYGAAQWQRLSDKLIMGQIKVAVSTHGFIVKNYYILTALLDEKAYPGKLISGLYWERWQIELNFRDIKRTL